MSRPKKNLLVTTEVKMIISTLSLIISYKQFEEDGLLRCVGHLLLTRTSLLYLALLGVTCNHVTM